MQQQHDLKGSQLAPIAEQPPHQQLGPSQDGLQPSQRQHANRPSRLSAVLVPPGAQSGTSSGSSPPPSPPSVLNQNWPGGIPKSASCDGVTKLDKQEAPQNSLQPKTSPKAASIPAPKSYTGASSPPPSSPSGVSPRNRAAPTAPAAAPSKGPQGPVTTQAGAQRAGHAASAPLTPTNSDASSSTEDENYDGEWAWDTGVPWYCKPRSMLVVVLLLASVGLVLAGLVLQVVFRDPDGLTAQYEDTYPWLYFFAAFPPLALLLRWLCWRLYTAAEYTAIREELYFLRPLKAKLASLLFWLVNLLWFQACFKWLWCHQLCGEEGYQKALQIVWRLLICVTLFAAANFLKCSIARMLSYSFYRTAHFAKVRDAIERELYLIRLSQARSTLLPPPPPEPCSDVLDQQDGMQRRAGAWGSTVWRKTSQVFLGQHAQALRMEAAAAEYPGLDQAGDSDGQGAGQYATAAGVVSAFAGAVQQQQQQQHASADGGMRHVGSADRIAEDAAVHIQLRRSSDTAGKQQQFSAGPRGADPVHLLQQQQNASSAPTPKVSWLQADLLKAQQQQQQHQQQLLQQHHQLHQPLVDPPGRQHSYELFTAERTPSILGAQHQSRSGSKAGSKAGSRAGSRVGQGLLRAGRTTSKFSTGSARKVSLPGMVAGVDGLLLQPEVLGASAAADGQTQRRPGQPMTPEELSQLRARLGVNTFGTFVDRYYGMTPKEEAAHVRQVKRFAKGLFANVLGDADRAYLLPEDFVLFFDGDEESAHDAFDYFDRNKDGSISCTELQESAAEMLCERKNIAASIKDTDSVVNSLETGLGMLIHFIFIAMYLLVWGVNIVQGFTTFSATALALTFVFGDSVKGVFESALFLFVEHPYDVGDALWMPPGMVARVKKIDLQYTVLLRGDGQLVWHPNNTLRTQPLVNLSRSQPRWEGYTWLVDMDTPDEVLIELQDALAAYVATQRAHYACNPAVTWRAMEDPLKMRLAVGVTYTFTGEDTGRYATARHNILTVVRRELSRMGVKYTVPVQQQTFLPVVQQATTPLQ